MHQHALVAANAIALPDESMASTTIGPGFSVAFAALGVPTVLAAFACR